jgi:hypothetical protein
VQVDRRAGGQECRWTGELVDRSAGGQESWWTGVQVDRSIGDRVQKGWILGGQ